MNDQVIYMSKATKLHQRMKGNKLATKYGFPEGSCVIPNKAVYMDEKNWEKVVKAVAPGIKKWW